METEGWIALPRHQTLHNTAHLLPAHPKYNIQAAFRPDLIVGRSRPVGPGGEDTFFLVVIVDTITIIGLIRFEIVSIITAFIAHLSGGLHSVIIELFVRVCLTGALRVLLGQGLWELVLIFIVIVIIVAAAVGALAIVLVGGSLADQDNNGLQQVHEGGRKPNPRHAYHQVLVGKGNDMGRVEYIQIAEGDAAEGRQQEQGIPREPQIRFPFGRRRGRVPPQQEGCRLKGKPMDGNTETGVRPKGVRAHEGTRDHGEGGGKYHKGIGDTIARSPRGVEPEKSGRNHQDRSGQSVHHVQCDVPKDDLVLEVPSCGLGGAVVATSCCAMIKRELAGAVNIDAVRKSRVAAAIIRNQYFVALAECQPQVHKRPEKEAQIRQGINARIEAPLIAASLLGKNRFIASIVIVIVVGVAVFRVVIARGNVGWVGVTVPIYVSAKLGRVLIRWRRRMGAAVVLDDFVLRLV